MEIRCDVRKEEEFIVGREKRKREFIVKTKVETDLACFLLILFHIYSFEGFFFCKNLKVISNNRLNKFVIQLFVWLEL